jgi:hypothetical protein
MIVIKMLTQMTREETIDIYIYQRDYALKSLLTILKKRKFFTCADLTVVAYVHENIDQATVIRLYFTIYLRANSLSVIRLYSAQALLFFIQYCMYFLFFK